MAKQQTTVDQQNQASQNAGQQDMTRSEQRRPRNLAGGYDPFGLVLSPTDLFRMGPFSLFRRMTEELDRMASGDGGTGSNELRAWTPTIEIEQRDNNYIVRAELAGVRPDDVTVEVTDDAIVLSGERREERDVERGGRRVTERRYGQFFRAIPLPEGAQADQVKARFENGMLEITIPTQEKRSGRRQIQVEGSGGDGTADSQSGAGTTGSSQSGGASPGSQSNASSGAPSTGQSSGGSKRSA